MSDPAVSVAAPPRSRKGCGKAVLVLAVLLVLGVGGFALYAWTTLSYSFSEGERAGYVQKLSKRGWLCKTWEGELAMVNLPGTLPQIFTFSVREDAVAEQINRTLGQRVTLHYEQHRGVPSTCFGESEYFVTGIRGLEGSPTPGTTP